MAPSNPSTLLRLLATLFGTIFLGFGLAYTLYPRATYPTLGLPLPLTPRDADIMDAVMILFGAKDLFVGASILTATWMGNRRISGVLLVLGSACAGVDGWVVSGMTGEGAWNHWGYGGVMGVVGVLMTGVLALNALANHGFIPRNGIASVDQIIAAASKVIGFHEDLAQVATIYSTVFAVSPNLNDVSIGGPLRPGDVTPDKDVGLKIRPQGLDFTHISLENDTSPTRRNKYEKGAKGDNYDLSIKLFNQLFNRQEHIADHKANFNIKVLAHHRYQRIGDSIRKNPKSFLQPFNGCFLQGVNYAAIYRTFADNSVEHPLGRLDRQTLMSFYSIYKKGYKIKYRRGGERIPDFWYRRPLDDPHTLEKANKDLLEMAQYHPELIDKYCAGGNMKKHWKRKYASIDIGNLTDGTYRTSVLRDGFNLTCAGLVMSAQTAPYWLSRYYDDFGKTVVPRLLSILPPLIAGSGCVRLGGTLDRKVFEAFLGFNESLKVPEA